jgi:hypothetical protein
VCCRVRAGGRALGRFAEVAAAAEAVAGGWAFAEAGAIAAEAGLRLGGGW